jgi:ComF family protein
MWRIFDIIFPPRKDEEVVRDLTDNEFLSSLSPRLVSVTRPESVVLLPFSLKNVRSTLHEAKYHGSERAFALLSLALIEYLREADEGERDPILIPVPLGEKRRRERGFNQTEEIARRVSKELDLDIKTDILIRIKETVSQVSLPRQEREENMRGAFGATHVLDSSRTYIIIDDVITTGATLQSCIDALREAGATHIIPLALAH